ncbi:Uncharacterised protein [Mycobacterium tuberculosis]|nr:Uncharacterised protein [Mycobacterium tuberculosis]
MIAPRPRIAASGWLITGTPSSTPSAPKFDTVNVEPRSSAGVRVPSRAPVINSATREASSRVFLSWASVTTGTSNPRSVAAPNPRCTPRCTCTCGPSPESTHVELRITLCFNAITSSRSVSANGVISGAAETNRSRSRSSSAQITSTLAFAVGISLWDNVIFSAIRACTPWTGRTSGPAPTPPRAAASTSARVITPPAPDPRCNAAR